MKRTNNHRNDAPRYGLLSPGVGVFLFLMLMMSISVCAQQKHSIQIKTFDQQLQPYRNIEVSINGKDYIPVGARGVAFTELADSDLPLKTIKIKNEQLEAASWNYSKGIVEIIVRKKSYQVSRWVLRDPGAEALANLNVVFTGKKTITVTTNAEGRFEIPLALDERITSASQFSITGYQIVKFALSDAENILTADRIKPVIPEAEEPVAASKTTTPAAREYFRDFDLSKLDSIQSLTVFYAIFRNYDISDFDSETKRRVDDKFNSLVKALEDSLRSNVPAFIGRISDSSFVRDDLQNLVAQVRTENQELEIQREDFDKKIRIIEQKLASGISNMNEDTRAKLLSELTMLERLLIENANQFYKNQDYYRAIIANLKEKFFDIRDLENKLSESEAQRLEEQRIFRQRLLAISGVVLLFAILIVLLIYFSNKLRKQKKELVLANAEVKRVNENLEGIVFERTRMLAEAHRELDTFLYRASHDLRSPVCSIIGLCNIASYLSQGEPKELIERVVDTTVKMDKLLKKLSIISEINQPSGFSSVNLMEVVKNIHHSFSKMFREHPVEFVINCPSDLSIYTYPNLIHVILSNLMENAIFYTALEFSEHARVEFTASVKGDVVEMSLYDNGIGIDKTISPRLFDMFFKGSEFSKGNGLGLYIVRKSVQALEGEITVESEPSHFTKFTVRLPLKPAPVNEGVLMAAGVVD